MYVCHVVALKENLLESKHHTLTRRSKLSDKDLKPNAQTRDQLNVSHTCPFDYRAIIIYLNHFFYKVLMRIAFSNNFDLNV